MLNLKFLPVHFSICLMIGIVIGYYFNISTSNIFILALVLIFFLIYFYYKSISSFNLPIYFAVFTAVLFVLIGLLDVSMGKPNNQKNHYSNIYTSNDEILLQIEQMLKSSTYYYKYRARIFRVDQKYTLGKVLINLDKVSKEDPLRTDDIIFTKNKIEKVNKALNPNEFDYREYLRKQGIYHHVRLKSDDFINLGSNQRTLKGITFLIRKKINSKLEKYNFSKDELAIINAILLGQRQDISKETFDNYKNAGAIHILAVSGLHIGIILLFLNFLLKPLENLKNGKKIKLFILVISLWMYAFLAGMSASVVRAVTMFTAIAIGLAINRPSSIQNSLVVSIFFLLLIKPFFLFDVGFQLSYTAVFSIIWIFPLFKKLWNPRVKFTRFFWQLLSVSFAAQFGILPLSLYYFHQFPGLFFISSLFIIPFLGIILGTGILIIILALVNLLPQFIADFYGNVIGFLNNFVAIISHQESFVFQNISFSFLLMISFYILIITTINWLYNKKTKTLLLALASIVFVQVTLLFEKTHAQNTKEFIIFHQVKNSIIGCRIGNKMVVYKNKDILSNQKKRVLISYKGKFANLQIQKEDSIRNIFNINSKKLLVVDSLGVYKNLTFKPDMILLMQSPKINLQRLLDRFHPEIIVADGSNYKSHILQWEKTCKNFNVRFHNTAKYGAFIVTY
jgi:competence protein ComEC